MRCNEGGREEGKVRKSREGKKRCIALEIIGKVEKEGKCEDAVKGKGTMVTRGSRVRGK